jgi:hypothetical protein
MDDLTETAWRAALQQRGQEWVVSQLRTRPGRPDDVVHDVVFEAPFPTRAFCVRWCAEQDNKIVRLSWHAYASIFLLLLVIVCFWQAIGGWKNHELAVTRQQNAPLPAASDRVGSSPQTVDVGIPNSYSQSGSSSASSSSSSASGGSTSSSGSPPSLCNYITYDTTRCPPRQQ